MPRCSKPPPKITASPSIASISYDWYLRLGPLSNANAKYFHDKIPTWNDFIAHSSYDEYWKHHAIAYGLKQPTVPNLNVAGWWDQEDFYGPTATYERLEKADTKNLNYFVAGPWNHGGWGHGAGNSLGDIPFGSDTSAYFRQNIEAPFFAYWLKDKGQMPLKEAITFQTGSDEWVKYDSWPPREAQTRNIYMREDGALSFTAPTSVSQPIIARLRTQRQRPTSTPTSATPRTQFQIGTAPST